ncbi:hypothetical protein EYF80_017270 [Liparis tanakae]|uniref:Uncharacterized protein n=1 Tax=Liparis tanakae TaxID=230148 RepID=A0A4Z2I5C0_9TELE|nr:hypothetical protein EYF80_017270 [Liparis tanakae]
MLKTAEPTIVPTPTSPLVMKTAESGRQRQMGGEDIKQILCHTHTERMQADGPLLPLLLGLTWCLDDLCEPNDSEQPDSTAAEPLEGPPCDAFSASYRHQLDRRHLVRLLQQLYASSSP